ncbi:MAG: MotA/TolQ/ExbB proton channel family protein [Planctomycetota bacterium]|nr:MotA/TolQ/ExbB proton channel family protein [Planctomycetota bacterium]
MWHDSAVPCSRGPGVQRARSLAFLFLMLALAGFVLWQPGVVEAQDTASTGGRPPAGLWSAVLKSKEIGIVIIACSIAGLSLAITFAFQIRRDVLVPPELLDQLQSLFDDEDYEEAYQICEANPSFLSAVVSTGLTKIDEGYDEMMQSMQETGEIESTKLHQKVGYLNLIANIAPMLGLLGTVAGMIITFNKIASKDQTPKPAELAEGIGIALGTTFLGLLVAIPLTAIFVFFRNRVINVVVEVSAITEELMSRFRSAS